MAQQAANCTFFPHTGQQYSYLIPDDVVMEPRPGDYLVVQGPRGADDYRVVLCRGVCDASTLNPTWSYKAVLFNLGNGLGKTGVTQHD